MRFSVLIYLFAVFDELFFVSVFLVSNRPQYPLPPHALQMAEWVRDCRPSFTLNGTLFSSNYSKLDSMWYTKLWHILQSPVITQSLLLFLSFSAPSRPPSNFTGQAPSSTKLTLEWKPVDELHINGVLRAYVIVYFITHSLHVTRHNITIPVTTARKRRAITNPSSPSYELRGLKKYTTYTVQVMAYTVDYGVPSLEVNITTAQDGNLLSKYYPSYYDLLSVASWFQHHSPQGERLPWKCLGCLGV